MPDTTKIEAYNRFAEVPYSLEAEVLRRLAEDFFSTDDDANPHAEDVLHTINLVLEQTMSDPEDEVEYVKGLLAEAVAYIAEELHERQAER